MRREPLAVSKCFECIEKLARRSCRANVVVVILGVRLRLNSFVFSLAIESMERRVSAITRNTGRRMEEFRRSRK